MPNRKNSFRRLNDPRSEKSTQQRPARPGRENFGLARKRMTLFMSMICLLCFLNATEVMSTSTPEVYLSSSNIPQGNLVLIRVKGTDRETPLMTWMKKKINLVPNKKKTNWYGFVSADLKANPGKYSVQIKMRPSGHQKDIEINITEKKYGVRRLTLPKKMVDLDAQTLKRVRKESGKMKKLWLAPYAESLWEGPFVRPVPGEVIGPFGRSSIINEQPRSPHSGVDLRAKRGTPIKTMNNGMVALVGDHFFTGLTVVIDHGGGIQSMYFHLDEILVEMNQRVTKGEVIGRVGSTGRATGPHLHLGVRVNGARVDPLGLTKVSEQLRE